MKNKILGASALLVVGVLTAGVVFAQTGTNPYSVTAGPNGNIKLSGTILSVLGTNWNVASWGGTWAVNVANVSTTDTFTAGDSVVVTGTTASSSLSINATSVKKTTVATSTPSSPDNGGKGHGGFWTGVFGKISNGFRAFFGVVSNLNVGANTFTLTGKNGAAAQVNVDASTTIRVGGATSTTGTIAGLANGMYAVVAGHASGTASSSVIAATKVKAGTDPLDAFGFWGMKIRGFFGRHGGPVKGHK